MVGRSQVAARCHTSVYRTLVRAAVSLLTYNTHTMHWCLQLTVTQRQSETVRPRLIQWQRERTCEPPICCIQFLINVLGDQLLCHPSPRHAICRSHGRRLYGQYTGTAPPYSRMSASCIVCVLLSLGGYHNNVWVAIDITISAY